VWTLTFDINLWPLLSVPGQPTRTESQVQRSVGSKDRVETNGETDGRTDRRYWLFNLYPANAVGKNCGLLRRS